MNTVEILKAARELISDEKNWTQEEYARDEHGDWASPLDEVAKCFCAIGALSRVSKIDPDHDMPGEGFLKRAAFEIGGNPSIQGFNDTHSHSEVLSLFDRAIARAESDAA